MDDWLHHHWRCSWRQLRQEKMLINTLLRAVTRQPVKHSEDKNPFQDALFFGFTISLCMTATHTSQWAGKWWIQKSTGSRDNCKNSLWQPLYLLNEVKAYWVFSMQLVAPKGTEKSNAISKKASPNASQSPFCPSRQRGALGGNRCLYQSLPKMKATFCLREIWKR